MLLEPVEVPSLPLAAALFDRDRRLVARTPEWQGPAPGSAAYSTGFGHLVVGAENVATALDGLLGRLLDELAAAAGLMASAPARRLEVLRAGLELVRGRPPAGEGSCDQVIDLVQAALPARAPGLALTLEAEPPWAPVPSPGALALALVQLAVNAQVHEQVDAVILRIAPGPTFYIEWAEASPGTAAVDSHRHQARRLRWGWGYVQMVADALGGVALPPGPTGTSREGVALSLGSSRLALPLAVVRGDRVERSTAAWDQERNAPTPGRRLAPELHELLARARSRPGQIVYRDLHRARSLGEVTWLALPPETGSSRARDVLRGLDHERALWSAPEPQATRLQALATLLGVALGEPWPTVPPSVWREGFPAACRALGVPPPPLPDALQLPEPRLAAFLLAELGGNLEANGATLALRTPPSAARHPVWRALGLDAGSELNLS